MLILTIRTDKPDAEIGIYSNDHQLAYVTWQAHRQLAETIHLKIGDLLKSQNYTLGGVEAVLAYRGPGSFTGLRIGLSVANTLAYALRIPVIATQGENWVSQGIRKLQEGHNDKVSLPMYGGIPNITKPRH